MRRFLKNHRIEILLFLTLLASSVYVFPRWADWSQNSRLDLVLAIVDQGTLRIDDYYQNTGDYALFEGHYYSDKAPGPVFLAVPVYAAARPILRSAPVQAILMRVASNPAFANTLQEEGTGLATDKIYNFLVLCVVTFAVISIPSAILGILLYRFLKSRGISQWGSIVIVLIYGLATNAFSYSAAFYSHQLSAFFLFGAFYLGNSVRRKMISPAWVAVIGFFLGYAVICEYPAALIGAGIFVYAILGLPEKKWIGALIAGGILPGILLMGYDLAIFHTILPVGYKYSELFIGAGNPHEIGFLSITYPHWDAMWGITFGSFRGLFYISPVLILALIGLAIGWRDKTWRAEWAVSAWAVLAFYFFYASSVMWQGGYGIGPRYLVPMLPFLATGFGDYWISWGKNKIGQIILFLAGIGSLAIVWIETLSGQQFPDYTPSPLFDYSLPRFLEGDIARNVGMILGLDGFASLLPLIILLIGLIYALWKVSQVALKPAA